LTGRTGNSGKGNVETGGSRSRHIVIELTNPLKKEAIMTRESPQTGSAGERRKHRRYPFIEDVLLDGTRRCTTADISEGGLYVSTIQAYEENDLIVLKIPSMQEDMTLKAKIVHSQNGIGFGLMFVDLGDEQKNKIRSFVQKLDKAS
jgi:hypothetical protein